MLVVKENIDNVQEFNYLYDSVGWGAYDESITRQILKRNIYSVSIYDDNKIIGYGRIIGDGLAFIYIQDVMVVPNYQSKKVGTKIMNELLKEVDKIKKINQNVRVYLGVSLNKEKFYEKFGFVTRQEYGLGAGMILKK